MAADDFVRETLPHLEALRPTARRLVYSGEQAEDLLQETYLLALGARERYQLGSNARAWLYRILVNAAHSAHRRAARDARLAERYGREAPTRSEPRGEGLTRTMEEALGTLPEHYRTVLELVDVAELGYAEAAERLGLPLGTVMSRLHRARGLLRHRLASPRGVETASRLRGGELAAARCARRA